KRKALRLYSDGEIMCRKCGEMDIMKLNLDHVVPRFDERPQYYGSTFYRKILKNPPPRSDLQVLCGPCNKHKYTSFEDLWDGIEIHSMERTPDIHRRGE